MSIDLQVLPVHFDRRRIAKTSVIIVGTCGKLYLIDICAGVRPATSSARITHDPNCRDQAHLIAGKVLNYHGRPGAVSMFFAIPVSGSRM